MTQSVLLFSAILLSLPFSTTVEGASVPDRVFQAAVQGQGVWVFLTDKGPDALRRLAPGTELVSTRAVARMQMRGRAADATLDLPSHVAYREALADGGRVIRQEARWFNAIAGIVDPRDLESI